MKFLKRKSKRTPNPNSNLEQIEKLDEKLSKEHDELHEEYEDLEKRVRLLEERGNVLLRKEDNARSKLRAC